MAYSHPLLVFSDLDGTLIDHETYRWDAAVPALYLLKEIGAGVVLASSKTAPEIIKLQDALDLRQWPAIVENGAGVLYPGISRTVQPGRYDDLLTTLNEVPTHLRTYFRGFSDMDVHTVAAITGLTVEAASLAMQRDYTEPGLWTGSAAACTDFLQELAKSGVTASEGGRFLTLSFGQNKSDVMAEIIAQYNPQHTVALGDAPNDIDMLQAADFGVIVANPHRTALLTLEGEADGCISRTKAAGPHGWNVAILDLIEHLNLNRGVV